MGDATAANRPLTRRELWWGASAGVIGAAMAWAAHLPAALESDGPIVAWFGVVDPLIGLLALVAVLRLAGRDRLAVLAASALLAVVSQAAVGPLLVALFFFATRSRWSWRLGAAVVIAAAGVWAAGSIYPTTGAPSAWWVEMALAGLTAAVVAAVGATVAQRRAVVAGLRERAELAEQRQRAQAESVRAEERGRIAHDMHDVVAHRISLVALHAAALRTRPDLSDERRAASMAAIETNARAALEELRDVLGVLRAAGDGTVEAPHPQRGSADIPVLIAETRALGISVAFTSDVDGDPPALASQAAYRVVREALSNARKHAGGEEIGVSIAGESGDGLAVRIANRVPSGAVDPLPGAGLGLVGIRERVERSGGRIDIEGGEQFVVSAWLPWDA